MRDDKNMGTRTVTQGGFTSGRQKLGVDLEEKLIFGNRIECEWLSSREAAQFLSVSENALRMMVYRDQVPAYKFGRRLRFKLNDCRLLFARKGA